MAAQVNTRFVIILSAVVIALVGGIAVVAMVMSKDVDDLVVASEQQFEAGEYDLALETMQRAVNRSKTNPAIIQKYIELAKEIPASDQVEADNTMNLVRSNTVGLARLDPNSEKYLQDYEDLIKHMIEKLQTRGGLHPFIRYLHVAAKERLEANPNDKLAHRMRGIYGMPLLNAEMTEDDINLVRDDLVLAMSDYPDDPEVVNTLAKWNVFQAKRLDQPGGDPQKAQQLRDEALAMSKKLLDAHPDDPAIELEYMQLMLQTMKIDRSSDDPYAEVKPVLDRLEKKLLAKPEPFNAVSLAQQYLKLIYAKDTLEDAAEEETDAQKIANNEGIQRSIALLERAAEANPEDPRYPLLLGVEYRLATEYEKANEQIAKVKDLSTQGNYLDVLRNYSLKNMALVEHADLMISLAEKADSDQERDRMQAEAQKVLEQMTATGHGENARVLLLKGRLAMDQGRTREGLLLIDQAAEKFDAFSREKAEVMLLSARARAQQGEWGAAAERYEQILEANPNFPVIRLALAGIYLRQQMLDKAQDQIDVILLDDPNNERALVTQAAILGARGDVDGAVAIYRDLDLPNRPDLAVGLAQILIKGNRKDQAARMLKHYYDADPTNLNLLGLLLNAVDGVDEQMALIEQARQAGADEDMLNLLSAQIDPSTPGANLDDTIANIVGKVDDPFKKAISKAQLYRQAGEHDKARAALAEAEKINPEDKAVIDMKFNYALQDKDLAKAQELADVAQQRNMDEANGAFYQAQVRRAQGDYAGAIEFLKVGLDLVPINSEGWRMLGDIYVADKNDRDAVPAYETALKQKPDNLGAIRGLASIRDRQGRNDEALEMLRRAQAQYPSNSQLRELYLGYEGRYGDKQKALRLRREQQQIDPDDKNNLRALAMLLAETGKSPEAEQIIRDLITTEGQTPLNTIALATIQRFAGNAQQGAQTIRSYIESRGSDAGMNDYLLLARFLIQIKDGGGAFNAYKQAIAVEDDQRSASRELAALFFHRNIYDRAVPLYRDLYEQFPDDIRLGLRLADSLIRTEQFDEAAKVLDGLEGGATEDALAALIAEQKGDHDDAIRLINRAIETEPGSAVFHYERAALNSHDPDLTDEVMRDLNTALSYDPNHLLSRRLLVGMYLRRGERNEAIRELTNLVTRYPENTDARLTLIRMYAQMGNLTRAKTLARQGIEEAQDQPIWHAALGDIALREDDYQTAIDSYKKVFELEPQPGTLLKITSMQIDNGRASDAQAMLRDNADMVNSQPLLQAVMGRALYAMDKQPEAKQVFARAIERCQSLGQLMGVAMQVREDYTLDETASLMHGLTNPPSELWIGLSLANMEFNDGLIEQAYDRLLALEPTLSAEDTAERMSYEQIMAPVLHKLGKSEEAMAHYRRLVEQMPDNATVLNNMAYLLADDMGKVEEALPLAERAAELQPKSAQVLDTLGWIQFKSGQPDEARRTLEASIAEESLPANHLHLGELLIEQGYRAEGIRHLRTAVELAEQTNEPDMLKRAQELLKRVEDLTEAS